MQTKQACLLIFLLIVGSIYAVPPSYEYSLDLDNISSGTVYTITKKDTRQESNQGFLNQNEIKSCLFANNGCSNFHTSEKIPENNVKENYKAFRYLSNLCTCSSNKDIEAIEKYFIYKRYIYLNIFPSHFFW